MIIMDKFLKEKFNIVISVGDEKGIGPEVILKALALNELHLNSKILIVGSKKNLIAMKQMLMRNIKLRLIKEQ